MSVRAHFHVIVSSKFHRLDKPVIYKRDGLWVVKDNVLNISSAQMGDVRSAWNDYISKLDYRLWGRFL